MQLFHYGQITSIIVTTKYGTALKSCRSSYTYSTSVPYVWHQHAATSQLLLFIRDVYVNIKRLNSICRQKHVKICM